MTDRRCRFGPAAKIEMIRRRERGESLRSIARSMACSPTTVKTAWDRWQDAAEEHREDFSCLLPRRPIARTCPWSLSADAEQRILEARAKSNWGPMRLMALTGRHRGTIYKVLKRHGVSRRRRHCYAAVIGNDVHGGDPKLKDAHRGTVVHVVGAAVQGAPGEPGQQRRVRDLHERIVHCPWRQHAERLQRAQQRLLQQERYVLDAGQGQLPIAGPRSSSSFRLSSARMST
jgi:hypothetical protein